MCVCVSGQTRAGNETNVAGLTYTFPGPRVLAFILINVMIELGCAVERRKRLYFRLSNLIDGIRRGTQSAAGTNIFSVI